MTNEMPNLEIGEKIYENSLACTADIENAVIESRKDNQPGVSFPNSRLRLESDVHFLLWFPPDFPDNIAVSWEFLPEVDDGLAMFWFCAKGRNGENLFDPRLKKRTGDYPEYNKSDINAYHVAYFRRNPWRCCTSKRPYAAGKEACRTLSAAAGAICKDLTTGRAVPPTRSCSTAPRRFFALILYK